MGLELGFRDCRKDMQTTGVIVGCMEVVTSLSNNLMGSRGNKPTDTQ